MKTIEEVIRKHYDDCFMTKKQTLGDECLKELSKAIRQHYLELLPKEEDFVGKAFLIPKLDRDLMKDPWFSEGIKIGIRECIQEMRERIRR